MNTVKLDQFNAQEQVRFVWPPSFALARAYLDQLERNDGLPVSRIAAVRDELASAERTRGVARGVALAAAAVQLKADIATASDKGRVLLLQRAIQDLSRVK